MVREVPSCSAKAKAMLSLSQKVHAASCQALPPKGCIGISKLRAAPLFAPKTLSMSQISKHTLGNEDQQNGQRKNLPSRGFPFQSHWFDLGGAGSKIRCIAKKQTASGLCVLPYC
mmetsp:Transcript_26987/g.43652  ORF Transcript_26987/g.43652 Transcript_26987/m.43652 type:complete len:115 (+) Transcript_26987:96-440(+)